MRNLTRWKWLPLAALATLGCTEASPQAGERGGACRISFTPCDDDMQCIGGECTDPSEETAVRELDGRFVLQTMSMEADGEDTTPVQVFVNYRDDGTPLVGPVRIWMEPDTAGVISPVDLELDENGRGVFGFQACIGEDPKCPDKMVFKVADWENPLHLVATSPIMTLKGGNPIGTSINGPAGDTPRPPDVDDPGPPANDLPASCRGHGTVTIDGESIEMLGTGDVDDRRLISRGESLSHRINATSFGLDEDGNRVWVTVVLGNSNYHQAPAGSRVGCSDGTLRSGSFTIPEESGLHISKGSVACLPSGTGIDGAINGSGSGSVTQNIACDGRNLVAWVMEFEAVCMNRNRQQEVNVSGCVRVDLRD